MSTLEDKFYIILKGFKDSLRFLLFHSKLNASLNSGKRKIDGEWSQINSQILGR